MNTEFAQLVLDAIYEKANSEAKTLYHTLSAIPFKDVRALLEMEVKAFEEGRLKGADGIGAKDIEIAKHKLDMFEVIYNELHAYAQVLNAAYKAKSN